MKKHKLFLVVGVVILGVVVTSVLAFAFSSAERQIMIVGSKDFKVSDMDQYDLDRKVLYQGTVGINGTEPVLPRAANKEVIVYAGSRIDDGIVTARITMNTWVYSKDLPEVGGEYLGVTSTHVAEDTARVVLGERVKLRGYTFRFVGAHISKSGSNYTALILEEIPDDVTVFPSGDPEVW